MTELTSAPDNRYWYRILPKIREKVSPIPISILHTRSIADTVGSNTTTAILTTLNFNHDSLLKYLFVTNFQYAQEIQCTNTKFSEKLNEDERNEMKLTGLMSSLLIRTMII